MSFRDRLLAGEPLFGTVVSLLAGAAGWLLGELRGSD